MSAEGPNNGWAIPVADFLEGVLPAVHGEGRDGWEDMASTAWQFGCTALVALGHATETKWGAEKIISPKRPDSLPRWDDICCVVLTVLVQLGELEYRLDDGTRYAPKGSKFDFIVLKGSPPPEPAPNIFGSNGTGPAFVSERGFELLSCLGLVEDGRWTDRAEMVLWREWPKAWNFNVQSDQRFADAVSNAATIPERHSIEIAKLVTVSTKDVDAAKEQRHKFNAELLAKHPNANTGPEPSDTQERRGILLSHASKLDWIFFCNWRLSCGWLDADQKARALEIFHDPLAIAMRRAVVERLYRNSDLARFTA